jgi:hypothetical protein
MFNFVFLFFSKFISLYTNTTFQFRILPPFQKVLLGLFADNPCSYPPTLTVTDLLSVSIHLPFLDILYTQNHAI